MCGPKLKTVEGVGHVVNLAGTLTFEGNRLKWTPVGKKKDCEGTLELSDIIAVLEADNDDSCLVVYHIRRKKRKLSVSKTALDCEDRASQEAMVKNVRSALNRLARPRNLVVIINPESGARKAVEVYGRKVAPLFALVGIKTEVMVTEQPKHATEFLKSHDLSNVDGVVAVGGDGTFNECVAGVLEYTKRVTNWAVSYPPEPLPAMQVPLGMIGAGTGNGLPLGFYNTKDVTSAALYIILGNQGPWNLATVNQGETFLGYSMLLVAQGLISDAIYYAENNRQMGRIRYLYCMLKAFGGIRSYPAEIRVRVKSKDAPDTDVVAPPNAVTKTKKSVTYREIPDSDVSTPDVSARPLGITNESGYTLSPSYTTPTETTATSATAVTTVTKTSMVTTETTGSSEEASSMLTSEGASSEVTTSAIDTSAADGTTMTSVTTTRATSDYTTTTQNVTNSNIASSTATFDGSSSAVTSQGIQDGSTSAGVHDGETVNAVDVTTAIDPMDVAMSTTDQEDDVWKVYRGRFVNYIMMPSENSGNVIILTLNGTFNRLNMVKNFSLMYNLDETASTENIKIIPNVQQFTVRVLTEEGYELTTLDRVLNIDGEYTPIPDQETVSSHDVEVHEGLLKVFCC